MRKLGYLLSLAALTLSAYAEDSAFLELKDSDGKDIVGQSVVKGYEKWINVEDLRWSVTAESSWTKGGGAAVGKPTPSPFRWTQGLEPSANHLFGAIAKGTHFDSAEFHRTRAVGSAAPEAFFKAKATDLFMTQVAVQNLTEVSAAGVFKSIELTYDPLDKGQATSFSWNVSSGAVSNVAALTPKVPLGNGTPTAFGGEVRAFLRLDANIAGDSTAAGYQNWIEIDDFGFSIDADTSFLKGSGAAVGKPEPGSLIWEQALDATVLHALRKITIGTSLPEMVIELVKGAGGIGPVTFAQMVFKDAFFTEVALNDDQVIESVVFKELHQTIFAIDGKGKLGAGSTFSWNIPAGTSGVSIGGKNNRADLDGFGNGMLGWASASTIPPPAAPGEIGEPGEIGAPVPLPPSWPLLLVASGFLARRVRAGHQKAS